MLRALRERRPQYEVPGAVYGTRCQFRQAVQVTYSECKTTWLQARRPELQVRRLADQPGTGSSQCSQFVSSGDSLLNCDKQSVPRTAHVVHVVCFGTGMPIVRLGSNVG